LSYASHDNKDLKCDTLNFVLETLKLSNNGITSTPLGGDASSRRYYRINTIKGTYILMIGNDKKENHIWHSLGNILREKKYSLPLIYGHNPKKGYFVLEDLGDKRLDTLWINASDIEQYYIDSIKELAKWHLNAFEDIGTFTKELYEPYTSTFVYENEFSYFLNGVKLIKFKGDLPEGIEEEGRAISDIAASYVNGKTLIHRDFQSRNIMIKDSVPYFIDWQGARVGPYQYDLASLIYDPYVSLPEDLVKRIAHVYADSFSYKLDSQKLLEEISFFGVIRLFQAFGAYAKLSKRLGKNEYAKYLPKAIERLKMILTNLTSLRFHCIFKLVMDLDKFFKEGTWAL
jgi:aminoglycoside/choline kinase family phosphotransferase